MKKDDAKLFTRIKKPFLEDDFFTTESEPEMEATNGSQATSGSSSQSQLESDVISETLSQTKTPEEMSQSNKTLVILLSQFHLTNFKTTLSF